MESIMPFDELNAVTAKLKEAFPDGKLVFNDDYEDIIDMLLDLFLLAFTRGNQITNMNLGTEWNLTSDDAAETINKKVAGKTWEERVKEYFSSEGTVDDLIRIAETETHRDANTAALETAKKAGAKNKTWITMADEKVRDTHQYLEMVTVGIDDEFYTYDGDHASAPGLFELAENNCNCRCELLFS